MTLYIGQPPEGPADAEAEVFIFGFFFAARQWGARIRLFKWVHGQEREVGGARWENGRIMSDHFILLLNPTKAKAVMRRLGHLLHHPPAKHWPEPGGEFRPARGLPLEAVTSIPALAQFAFRLYGEPKNEDATRRYYSYGKRFRFTSGQHDAVCKLLADHHVPLRMRRLHPAGSPRIFQQYVRVSHVLRAWVEAVLDQVDIDDLDRKAESALYDAGIPVPPTLSLADAVREAGIRRFNRALGPPDPPLR
jgi:hypothetical protein